MIQAAIYLRQSMDRDKTAEGIARQRARCTSLIEARGWKLVDEFADNDVSASKPRGPGTEWHRLIQEAKAGRIDVIVAVNEDRLLRGIRDLLTLIESGLRVATVDGEIDLTTADGEFRATMSAGLARFEVRRKSERQKRANAQRRSDGAPPSGRRAFGYTQLRPGGATTTATRTASDGTIWPDFGHEPHPKEAAAVRQGYALALAGASLRSISRRWNDAGLRTTRGYEFDATVVRAVLLNPRNAGLITPPRELGTATSEHYLSLDDLPVGRWEPLVDVATWQATRDLLANPTRRANPGGMPRTLLSGIARCGICGAPVRAGVTNGIMLYRCSESAHMGRKRDDADNFIEHIVLDRLARADVAAAILRRDDGVDVSNMRADLLAAQTAEANVLALVSQGLTTMDKATASLRDIRERVGALEAAVAEASRESELAAVLVNVTGDYEQRWQMIGELWEDADVDQRRAIVRALMGIRLSAPRRGSRAPKDEAGRLAHTEAVTEVIWRHEA